VNTELERMLKEAIVERLGIPSQNCTDTWRNTRISLLRLLSIWDELWTWNLYRV